MLLRAAEQRACLDYFFGVGLESLFFPITLVAVLASQRWDPRSSEGSTLQNSAFRKTPKASLDLPSDADSILCFEDSMRPYQSFCWKSRFWCTRKRSHLLSPKSPCASTNPTNFHLQRELLRWTRSQRPCYCKFFSCHSSSGSAHTEEVVLSC